MTHLSTSVYLALLLASPFILIELFRFITPALYDNERKYSARITCTIFLLFITGVLMSYFVIFPFSIRFLGTYQVSEDVVNMINLSSYISTFTALTFMMGIVFQIPVISFFLAKMGILEAEFMARYRRHALIIIMILAAIITPPDIFTLVLVTIPMYALYELSILIVKRIN
jgi:sec-independent protein translocase protein TatC